MRHDPEPWLKWCQDTASGRLQRCGETDMLARVARLNRDGRWWVQCTIDPAKIGLEAKPDPALLGWVRRGEGVCFHADGRDLHRWLIGDALRDLEVVVEQTPPGTIWWLMNENDPSARNNKGRGQSDCPRPPLSESFNGLEPVSSGRSRNHRQGGQDVGGAVVL